MKTILILLSFAAVTLGNAEPVTISVVTIANPKIGQAPAVNKVAPQASAYYRMTWRTAVTGTTTINYLTSFVYDKSGIYTADRLYAATTYAEMLAEATMLGVTNLPADPNAGH